MASGIPFGFGAVPIPNADPEDVRRLFQRGPFDQMQAPALQPAADLNGPAGALIHQPGARVTTIGPGLASPVAMDEAQTQALERSTGMVPDDRGEAAAPGLRAGLLGSLFDPKPMGAPQSFAGATGVTLPTDKVEVPLPPRRQAGIGLGFGDPAPAAPRAPAGDDQGPTARADAPAPGSVPMRGQAPISPGLGFPLPGQSAPSTPPAAAASPSQTTQEPSFGDRFSAGMRRFMDNGGGDQLMALGAGLLSAPGAQGWSNGMKNMLAVGEHQSKTNLLRQEFGLRMLKAAQDQTGLKGNRALVKAAFPNLTEEQLQADNSQLVTAAIAKLQNPNAGRDIHSDGSGVPRWTDTGQSVFGGDEGKTKWVQAKTPNGGTILYDESDPSKNQTLIPGEPAARPATADELAQWGIQPGQAAKMTAKGPELLGRPERPQVQTFKRADGTEETLEYDPRAGGWKPPNAGGGASPMAAPTNPYATGKFNETQGKAAGFADRMMGSEPIIRQMESVGQNPAGGMLGRLPSLMKTEDRQKMEQAQREFVNAVLRRESGAAISPSEFESARAQYFPQPGEGAAVTAQKREARQRAIEAMGRESGPAYAPAKRFDGKGSIVPSAQPADRFKQLRASGLSKEDAYARMHSEGY